MQETTTPHKVLIALADGQFHSGQELGESLQLTRSAIWKAVRQLQALGLAIQSVVGKGYRIVGGIELLDRQHMMSELTPQSLDTLSELFVLTHIDSTNDFLLSKANTGEKATLACVAETQTHGKGRRGRHWQSPFGTNLYFSLLWHFKKMSYEVIGASQAVAIALLRALKKLGVKENIQLKWPNDILWEQKKIAGILCEISAEQHGHCSLVIGIGINTALPAQAGEYISQPFADLATIMKKPISRNKLASFLINELIALLPQFEKAGLTPFLDEWNEHDAFIDKAVTLTMGQNEISGTMKGISTQGELILTNPDGQTNHYLTGFIEKMRPSPC